MSNGINGKIIHFDLTKNSWEIEYPDDSFYRKYVGGSTLGLYYALKYTPPGIDAFNPGNTLVFALSPLTGAPLSGQSRLTIVAKSPLTGLIGDSQSGGFFPAELKFTGYDAVVVHGRSEQMVYLWITNDQIEIRTAEHLRGKTTGEVEDTVKQELKDPKVKILQCGLAGENLVRFASVMSMCNRANGRNGMGAVMGSKNLKAIVVRGKKPPPIFDTKKLVELSRKAVKDFKDSSGFLLNVNGTAGILESQNSGGGLPTNNWQSGYYEDWQDLDGATMTRTILKERDTCYSCIVRCKRVVEINDKNLVVDPKYGGPEYETLGAFGSYCGINNLKAVSYANQLCNMYGMDTISCGATISWAMECFEKGILNLDDTGGIDLRFGNSSALLKITENIARRKGFGNILAEGSFRAAQKFGKKADDLVVTAKKQELPAHMPQVKRGLALVYAVNPFGADHESSAHDPDYSGFPERMASLGLVDPQIDNYLINKEKVKFMLVTEYLCSSLDTLNLCQLVFGAGWQLYGPDDIVCAVNAVTGWNVSIKEILELGERRLNMMRVFNSREGVGRETDILPKKMEVPLRGGKSNGLFISEQELEEAKDYYYHLAGWRIEDGNPTTEKLVSIGLDWLN